MPNQLEPRPRRPALAGGDAAEALAGSCCQFSKRAAGEPDLASRLCERRGCCSLPGPRLIWVRAILPCSLLTQPCYLEAYCGGSQLTLWPERETQVQVWFCLFFVLKQKNELNVIWVWEACLQLFAAPPGLTHQLISACRDQALPPLSLLTCRRSPALQLRAGPSQSLTSGSAVIPRSSQVSWGSCEEEGGSQESDKRQPSESP